MEYFYLSQKILPQHVFDEVIRFISGTYFFYLPNSLLIAQAFILKYPAYGREYGLSTINKAVEYAMSNDYFSTSLFK
jgi:hypothetical protein